MYNVIICKKKLFALINISQKKQIGIEVDKVVLHKSFNKILKLVTDLTLYVRQDENKKLFSLARKDKKLKNKIKIKNKNLKLIIN